MATIKSIEEKAKRYDEAIIRGSRLWESDMITRENYEYIFPEVKESEDERIREALIEMVHDTTGDSLWVDYNVHKEDALAWLEKQCEQKQELLTKEKALKNSPFVEQKSSWSEEDNINCKRLLYFLDGGHLMHDHNIELSIWLKHLKDRVLPQPSQEWAEEDEKMLECAIDMIEWYSVVDKSKSRRVSDWFKSLKYRVQPQTQWKPSDEQMEGIECTIETLRYQLNAGDNRLDSLYNDLKKLRKE